MSESVTIQTSWPPSINTYWRRNGGRYFITPKGIAYRDEVIATAMIARLRGKYNVSQKLGMLVEAYPPDRRKRDLDNVLKPVLDALQHAGVYVDDAQIDKLSIWRCSPNDGLLVINIGII